MRRAHFELLLRQVVRVLHVAMSTAVLLSAFGTAWGADRLVDATEERFNPPYRETNGNRHGSTPEAALAAYCAAYMNVGQPVWGVSYPPHAPGAVAPEFSRYIVGWCCGWRWEPATPTAGGRWVEDCSFPPYQPPTSTHKNGPSAFLMKDCSPYQGVDPVDSLPGGYSANPTEIPLDRSYCIKARHCPPWTVQVSATQCLGPAAHPATLGGTCPKKGNPISIANGNKYQHEVDIQPRQPGAVELSRSFNSLLIIAGDTGTMGPNWLHSYDRRIASSPDSSTKLKARRATGKTLIFNQTGATWTSDTPTHDSLIELRTNEGTRSGFEYRVFEDDSVEYYDALGLLSRIKARSGVTQTIERNRHGGISRVTDTLGGELAFEWDVPGNEVKLMRVTHRSHGTLLGTYTFSYDAQGRLERVTQPTGLSRTYHYEPTRPLLVGITDEAGRRYVGWTYDEHFRGTSSSGAGNENRVTFQYHDDDSVTVTEDGKAPQTYVFALFNGLPKATSVSNGTCASSCGGPVGKTLTYYPNGDVETAVDENGVVTHFEWDSRGRERVRIEAFGSAQAKTVTTDWHSVFNLRERMTEVEAAPPAGGLSTLVRVTEWAYDNATGDLLEERVTSGADVEGTMYTYDSPGLLKTETTGTKTVTYSYDHDRGLLKSSTDSLGNTVTFTYDAFGREKTVTSNGVTTTYSYKPNGRLASMVTGLEVTTYDYDSVGRLKSVVLPTGQKRSLLYDGESMRVSEVRTGDAPRVQSRVVLGYDAEGNVNQRKTYDGAGVLQLTEAVTYDSTAKTWTLTDSGGRTTVITHDAFRRPLTSNSAQGVETYAYDAHAHIKEVSLASGAARYFIDSTASGAPLRVRDAKNVATTFQRDGLERTTQMAGTDWGTKNYSYWPLSGLAREEVGRQVTTYDDSHRARQVSFLNSDGTPGVIDFSYQVPPKEQRELARVSKRGQTEVETAYSYDDYQRLTREETRVRNPVTGAMRNLSVQYGYTAGGQVNSLTYPSGAKVVTTYVDGLPQRLVFSNAAGATIGAVNDVVYDAFGRLKSWKWGTLQHTRTYDSVKQVLRVMDTPGVYRRELTYTAKDEVQSVRSFVRGVVVGNNTYQYDSLGRIVRGEGGTRAYDANGNVTQQVKRAVLEASAQPVVYPAPLAITNTLPTSEGLVGQWKFDEGSYTGAANEVRDSGPFARHGRMTSAMLTSDGVFGRALETRRYGASTTAATMIVADAALPTTSDAFTAQVWVKTTDRTSWRTLMSRVNVTSSVYNGWLLQMGDGDGKVFIRVDTSGGQGQGGVLCSARKATDPVVADGRWHLVTTILNQGSCKLFIDGVKYADGTYVRGAGFTSAANFAVYGNVVGQFDEVTLWSRPLTESEVANGYSLVSSTPFANSSVNTGAGATMTEVYTTHANSNRLQVSPGSTVKSVIHEGLVGHWKFDATSYVGGIANEVTDSSGFGRHGTLSGGGMTTTTGIVGNALNRLVFPNRTVTVAAAALPASREQQSAQIWVRSTDTTPWQTLMGRMDYGTAPINGWILQVDDRGKAFLRIDTSAATNQSPCNARRKDDPVVMDGQWHHIAVTINDGNCKLFIDGVKYADNAFQRGMGFTAPNANFFVKGNAGFLDEAALWSRALADAEVFHNYRVVKTSFGLSYTADGHQTNNQTGGAFLYNSLGELEGFGDYRYSYNAESRRVAKVANTAVPASYKFNTYAYDTEGRLLGEYDKDGIALYEVVYLDSTPVVLLKSAGVYLIAADQVDAPRAVFRDHAPHDVVWQWQDSAFGEAPADGIQPLFRSGGSFVFNLRFPGQVYDVESGLHYNHMRYYNPTTGRYLQADRVGLRGGLNAYAYADATPLSRIDPAGTTSIAGGRAIRVLGAATARATPIGRVWSASQLVGEAIYSANAIGIANLIDGLLSSTTSSTAEPLHGIDKMRESNSRVHEICDNALDKLKPGDSCDQQLWKMIVGLACASARSEHSRYHFGSIDETHVKPIEDAVRRYMNALRSFQHQKCCFSWDEDDLPEDIKRGIREHLQFTP